MAKITEQRFFALLPLSFFALQIVNGLKECTMDSGRHSFGGKNTDRLFSSDSRSLFLLAAGILAFCLFASYAKATVSIAAGQTVTIPSTQSSPWTIGTNLAVDGTMNVLSGGSVSNVEGFISLALGSTGSVIVDGAGSTWSNSDRLLVGFDGYGSLAISNGGTVSSVTGYLGWGQNTSGTVTVDGADSAWTNTGELVVGRFGTGSLTISNGATVSNTDATLGYYSNSSGSVTVDGVGSTWVNSGYLYIGRYTVGSLAVSNGATVSNTIGAIGYNSGSSGTVVVDGAGSAWVNTSDLYAGAFATGSLAISNGAKVSSSRGFIGYGANALGTVTVDGTDSAWANTGAFYIGYSGTGSLAVSNGAKISNSIGWIGYEANASGTVTVDGAGSTWANTGSLYIGRYGIGSLAVSNGAKVSNSIGWIGYLSGSSGTVTVDGAGSTWANSSSLYLGYSGVGSLAISNGANVSNATGWIGYSSGSSGTVTVDGDGSTWANTGALYIGRYGTGSLAVSNGAKVSNSTGWIGSLSGSSGTVTVDGAGSTWVNTGNIYVGSSGTGSLAVNDHGLVSTSNEVLVAVNSGSKGSLDVTSGGVLEALALKAGAGNASVTFDGGALRAVADNQAFITGFGTSGFAIAGGGLIIDDNGYAIATDSSAFSGVGGLTKTGAGTLTLGGVNTYSGPTAVALGTLKAGAADVFSQASAFTVHAGATLDLDGYNQTVASLSNSGTIRTGSAASFSPVGATLTVNGNYESNGGSLYLRTALYDDFSLTDKLVADSVTTGGGGATRLYVANIDGAGAYTASDGIQVVQVATTSDSGAFVLGAPVTAGIYEYVLDQGADQSWYLTNVKSSGGDTIQNSGENTARRTILYNPNIGSYLGNQYAAATMFNQNILDRRNSVRSPDQPLWIRTNYNSARSDILGDKQKVTIKTVLVQAGADLVQYDDVIAGIYVGYGHSDIDNRSRQTGTTADGKVDGYHIGAYATWMPEKDTGPYVDMWTYYALYDNELSGSAQHFGKTEYDSSGYALSGEVGYGFELHKDADGSAWILEPHLQLTYINIDADNFTDSNGTRYTDNRSRGCQTRAGARLYGQLGSGKTGINPFAELNWLHNHVDNGIRLDGKYVSSNIARDAGEVKVGLQGQATDNLNLWGHLGVQQGNNSFERYEAQLGLAWRW